MPKALHPMPAPVLPSALERWELGEFVFSCLEDHGTLYVARVPVRRIIGLSN